MSEKDTIGTFHIPMISFSNVACSLTLSKTPDLDAVGLSTEHEAGCFADRDDGSLRNIWDATLVDVGELGGRANDHGDVHTSRNQGIDIPALIHGQCTNIMRVESP